MRTISGATRFGGLIGRGLSHSLSPLIHNTAAAILGIDAVYHAFDLSDAPGEAFFDLMLTANCYGFNVTLPYKEVIAERLSRHLARPLLTANTLVARGSHWEVTSTDADGFCAGLGEIGRKLADFAGIICMGYGGAAKALLQKIRAELPGCPIWVLRRTPNAQEQAMAGVHFVDFNVEALTTILRQCPNALLIQGTSSPLRGDPLERFVPALAYLQGAFVDLVYGTPSALLMAAAQRKIPCQDGIPMLIHQALLSQKLWWGQSAEFSAIKAALAARA